MKASQDIELLLTSVNFPDKQTFRFTWNLAKGGNGMMNCVSVTIIKHGQPAHGMTAQLQVKDARPDERQKATSEAAKRQIPLQQILSAAGWSNDCTFRRFYNRNIEQKLSSFDRTLRKVIPLKGFLIGSEEKVMVKVQVGAKVFK